MGDWAPGTKTRTIIVNIETDEAEKISHVGIGYHLLLPSGRIAHSSGWTWHGDADEHDGDPELVEQLQAIVDRIRADLAEHEGLEDGGEPEPPGVLREVI